MKRIIRDLGGILCIGDGVVGALIPSRHTRRYETGPSLWRSVMRFFARRRALTRTLAVGQVATGLWLTLSQP